jgi:hypothetical protein
MIPYPPKSAIIGILVWYLTEHWFDYFCAPWTFDDIIKGRHVPYPLAIGICAGAIAWAWRTQEPTVFWLNCFLTLLFHLIQPEAWEWPFLTNSIFICVFPCLAYEIGRASKDGARHGAELRHSEISGWRRR